MSEIKHETVDIQNELARCDHVAVTGWQGSSVRAAARFVTRAIVRSAPSFTSLSKNTARFEHQFMFFGTVIIQIVEAEQAFAGSRCRRVMITYRT